MVKFMENQNSGFNSWMANRQNNTDSKKKSSFTSILWWTALMIMGYYLIFGFDKKTEVVTETVSETVIEIPANVPVNQIANDDVTVSVRGIQIFDAKLNKYKETETENTDITLLGADNNFAEFGLRSASTITPDESTVWKISDNGKKMVWTNKDNVTFTRTLSIEGYVVTVNDEIKNNSGKSLSFAPYAKLAYTPISDDNVAVSTGGIVYENNDLTENGWGALADESFAYQTTNGFAGYTEQYWESVVAIDSADQTILVKPVGDVIVSDITAGEIIVNAGAVKTINSNLFNGPRDQKILDVAATKIPYINETMDYGFFGFLARPMLAGLNFLHAFVLNYGVAIILLTLLLRLLMWPLTKKSYVSMAAMQKMQPEMKKIQKLYANDKARLQMEMMKLYQTHKTSPMSGCLPMLLQIPIFFALYKALLISVPMRQADFLWISDLAAMDPFFILPIIMGATMWWQQSLQSAASATDKGANDPMAQTQKMMKWMPVIFTIMFAWMPAGLVLYWTVSNLFGIGQMYIIKKTTK